MIKNDHILSLRFGCAFPVRYDTILRSPRARTAVRKNENRSRSSPIGTPQQPVTPHTTTIPCVCLIEYSVCDNIPYTIFRVNTSVFEYVVISLRPIDFFLHSILTRVFAYF